MHSPVASLPHSMHYSPKTDPSHDGTPDPIALKLRPFQLGNPPTFLHFQKKRAAALRRFDLRAILDIYAFEIALIVGLLCAFALLAFRFPFAIIAPPLLYLYANRGEFRKGRDLRKHWALEVYNPSIYTEVAGKASTEEIFAAAWKETMRKFYLLAVVILCFVAMIVFVPFLTGDPRYLTAWKITPLARTIRAGGSTQTAAVAMLVLTVPLLLVSCYLSWKNLFLFEAIPENVHASRPRMFIYASILFFLTLFIISAADMNAPLDAFSFIHTTTLAAIIVLLLLHNIFQLYMIRRHIAKLHEDCPDLNIS